MWRGFEGRVLLASVATLLLTAATPAGLVSTRGLVQRLGRAGRATVAFRAVTRSEGGVRARRGTLALEPPDRVRIDFPALGERIALRSDGGEWVQPAARQMLTLTTQHVASTMGLWRLFLNPEEGLYAERRLTANRFRLGLAATETTLPESVTVTLAGTGLPSRIEFVSPAGDLETYEFGAWRFGPARGAAGFRLAAPRGYEVLPMP